MRPSASRTPQLVIIRIDRYVTIVSLGIWRVGETVVSSPTEGRVPSLCLSSCCFDSLGIAIDNVGLQFLMTSLCGV